MTTVSRGDIVFVPFIFTRGSKAKARPAIVISSDAYHASRRDVIIAGITGNLSHGEFVGQMVIHRWQDYGLSKPSTVSGIIQTVRDDQIGERVATLTQVDQDQLDSALRSTLGL